MAQVPISRMARRVHKEARGLVREARRGLRRHADELPETVRDRLRLSAETLDKACAARDEQVTRRELATLDELVDEHLAFSRKSTIREYVESIGAAVLIAFLLRGFVVEAFKIPSGSMIPTMEIGDHIFVNKFLYGVRVPFTDTKIMEWRSPRPGEVVVFRNPCDPDKDFIKRVVAVAGDVVEVRCDILYVNNIAVPATLLDDSVSYFDNGSTIRDGCSILGSSHWSECLASDYLASQSGGEYHTYYSTARADREAARAARKRVTDYWSYVPGREVALNRTVHDFPLLDSDDGAMSSADALMPDGDAIDPPGNERLAAVVRWLAGETAEAIATDLSVRHRGRAWCERDHCIDAQDVRAWVPPAPQCEDGEIRPENFNQQLRAAPENNDTCGPKLGFEIPAGHLWAMGDNREKSSDSRSWGPVPLENVKGKALFIWWASQPSYAAGRHWSRIGKIVD